MSKSILSFLLLLAISPAAFAQQPGPAGTTLKGPVVLKAGHMQAQAHGAANRPDKAPQFPGGAPALGVFFQQHVKYPEAARVKNITGNVLLTATVGTDGMLSDFKVAQSLSPECDAEALRAAAQLPAWQPATRKGVPVPVLIQLPVPFANGAVLKVEK
ncbi:energy transducer TonB [Hymenobacter rubidus]|uniref:energy transducer TonB n=1 Tax=Hymenobacter rubidus TaxID=1441626 RepID=UPI00191E3C34|nr:energy transducer TonB [Hymenobacter rubidus]